MSTFMFHGYDLIDLHICVKGGKAFHLILTYSEGISTSHGDISLRGKALTRDSLELIEWPEGPAQELDHDALAAMAIMEWGLLYGAWYEGNKLVMGEPLWHPMIDIAQADKVRKAMEAKGWRFDIYTNSPHGGHQIVVWKKDAKSGQAREDELSAGIVKASLRAVEAIE